MKTYKIFFLLLMLSGMSATAQYGNSYNNSRLNNNMPESSPVKPTAADIEKQRTERVDKIMAKLKTDLSLDDLQFIAIKNEITANTKSMEILMKSENSDEAKNKEIIAIQEKGEKTILSYLNASQKEKYQKMKEDRATNKDKKKKNKKEKDTE